MELLTTNLTLPDSVDRLSLLLTDDKEVRTLNFQYRKLNKTTDVLSFALLDCNSTEGVSDNSLGDIVISVPKAIRQCKRFKSTPANELIRLLVHGILHLFGYDHVGVSKKRILEMQALEDSLLMRYALTSVLKS